jgi:hypothetical protein
MLGLAASEDGPNGSCDRPAEGRSSPSMDPRGILHRIEDDLAETWVEEWAHDGVEAIETYLAKHSAFQSFLDETSS